MGNQRAVHRKGPVVSTYEGPLLMQSVNAPEPNTSRSEPSSLQSIHANDARNGGGNNSTTTNGIGNTNGNTNMNANLTNNISNPFALFPALSEERLMNGIRPVPPPRFRDDGPATPLRTPFQFDRQPPSPFQLVAPGEPHPAATQIQVLQRMSEARLRIENEGRGMSLAELQHWQEVLERARAMDTYRTTLTQPVGWLTGASQHFQSVTSASRQDEEIGGTGLMRSQQQEHSASSSESDVHRPSDAESSSDDEEQLSLPSFSFSFFTPASDSDRPTSVSDGATAHGRDLAQQRRMLQLRHQQHLLRRGGRNPPMGETQTMPEHGGVSHARRQDQVGNTSRSSSQVRRELAEREDRVAALLEPQPSPPPGSLSPRQMLSYGNRSPTAPPVAGSTVPPQSQSYSLLPTSPSASPPSPSLASRFATGTPFPHPLTMPAAPGLTLSLDHEALRQDLEDELDNRIHRHLLERNRLVVAAYRRNMEHATETTNSRHAMYGLPDDSFDMSRERARIMEELRERRQRATLSQSLPAETTGDPSMTNVAPTTRSEMGVSVTHFSTRVAPSGEGQTGPREQLRPRPASAGVSPARTTSPPTGDLLHAPQLLLNSRSFLDLSGQASTAAGRPDFSRFNLLERTPEDLVQLLRSFQPNDSSTRELVRSNNNGNTANDDQQDPNGECNDSTMTTLLSPTHPRIDANGDQRHHGLTMDRHRRLLEYLQQRARAQPSFLSSLGHALQSERHSRTGGIIFSGSSISQHIHNGSTTGLTTNAADTGGAGVPRSDVPTMETVRDLRTTLIHARINQIQERLDHDMDFLSRSALQRRQHELVDMYRMLTGVSLSPTAANVSSLPTTNHATDMVGLLGHR
jgi:hypothetical protein